MADARADALLLGRNGWVPNNARFPVLVYRRALPPAEASAAAMERLFAAHGWPPQWRNGVFAYHHYHSTSHEVLGFARGRALLVLGGPGGREIEVEGGDILLLPVGTGHCQLEASADVLVVGAYPPGLTFDICRGAPDEAARRRIASLERPASDPVGGRHGAVFTSWPS